MLNTPHFITAQAPLLRPGLSITIVTSEKYAEKATLKLFDIVRKVNEALAQQQADEMLKGHLMRGQPVDGD